MSPAPAFREAILAQPENLHAASEAFAAAVADVDLGALCSGTIVFSGIGASAHALIPAVLTLRAAGRRAFAVSAAELRELGAARLGDAFVLVSQSGASVETLAALERIDSAPVVAVSAREDSPLARAARAWLPLGPMPDTPVATLSYTATLQTLGMLCDALLGRDSGDTWDRIPDVASEVLERSDPIAEQLAAPFSSVIALDAVGGGGAHASAGETALLAREALQVPATGMETREYLHGPLEAVDAAFGCVVFGAERERRLAGELTQFGAEVLMIGERAGEAGASASVDLPEVSGLAAPILEILPVQLLVDRVASLRGLKIGPLSRHQDDTKVP